MSESPREHVGRTIEKEIRIEADPRAIWEAWARPDRIAQWFVDRAEGEMEPGATVVWHFQGFGPGMPVQCFEAQPGRRLAFGGEIPGRPPALQTIEIEQEGGASILRLANSGFLDGDEWEEEYQGVSSGWSMALATLKHWLERYPDRRRLRVMTMAPAAYEPRDLRPRLVSAEGLATWLASSAVLEPDPLAQDGRARLDLAEGGRLSGRVLTLTPTEALLEWSEVDGVLGLKAFRLGPQGRFVGLDLSAWGLGAERAGALRAGLERALGRLVGSL